MLAENVKRGGDRKSKSKSHDVTLKDAGVSKMQSHRWQRIASVPTPTFEAHIGEVVVCPCPTNCR
jgi:hypothetical protein